MSYDLVERSEQSRRPVEIYTFYRDFQPFRYTSADRDITVDGATFLARSISRSAIESGQEIARQSLSITAQRDLEVADLFRVSPPSVPVTCLLQQFHEGDGQVAALWNGRVVQVEWQGMNAVISCEAVYTTMRRVGLRRAYQKQCAHVLYGGGCKVNREAYRVEAPADAVTGAQISVALADTFPDGYFAGGIVEFTIAGGLNERRFIASHVGPLLGLNSHPLGLGPGEIVRLYPGCDHTIATCSDKFSNSDNYGGMPYIPTKNPFGGDPVY